MLENLSQNTPSLLFKDLHPVLLHFPVDSGAVLDLGDIDQVHRRVQRCSYTLQQTEKCQATQAAVHHKVYITAGSCRPLGIGTKQHGPFDPCSAKTGDKIVFNSGMVYTLSIPVPPF